LADNTSFQIKIKETTTMSKKESKNDECVRVVVRCRPLNPKEKESNMQPVVKVNQSRGEI